MDLCVYLSDVWEKNSYTSVDSHRLQDFEDLLGDLALQSTPPPEQTSEEVQEFWLVEVDVDDDIHFYHEQLEFCVG